MKSEHKIQKKCQFYMKGEHKIHKKCQFYMKGEHKIHQTMNTLITFISCQCKLI